MTPKIRGPTRFFVVWKVSVMKWIVGNQSGLESTVRHFKKHGKARFYQDNFIEQIDFDYLEIEVIEEDRRINKLFCT